MSENNINTVSLGEVLEYEQPTNYIVDKADYNDEFEIPVLTAGKTFLLGYTNETHNVFSDVPVIIFDDFTTAFKYVDFPFKVKSSAMKILKAKEDVADIKFLFYRMMKTGIDTELHKRYWISKYSKLKIPLPPLDQQKKIAAILDAADSYRQKTKAVIAKYDELTQSLFLDMFGDPVKNPKNLEVISLVDYGSFKNGLNFGRNESGVKLKYLGVGSFKSFYKIDDLDTLSSIELNILPSEGYLLKDGDLVFVRSNGNKALVGRCVEITCGSTKVTFSGFCIRYRVTSDKVNPSYLAQLFRNKSFKSLMLQGGRGANIQNINQKILSEIRIPVPEISLQNKFIRNIKAIELQKTQAEASLVQAENLFNS